MRRNVIKRH